MMRSSSAASRTQRSNQSDCQNEPVRPNARLACRAVRPLNSRTVTRSEAGFAATGWSRKCTWLGMIAKCGTVQPVSAASCRQLARIAWQALGSRNGEKPSPRSRYFSQVKKYCRCRAANCEEAGAIARRLSWISRTRASASAGSESAQRIVTKCGRSTTSQCGRR